MLIRSNHRPSHRSLPWHGRLRLVGGIAVLAAVVGAVGTEPAVAQDPERAWTKEEKQRILQEKKKLEALVKKLRAAGRAVREADASDPSESPQKEPTPRTRIYKVKKGDTLAALAHRFLGSPKRADQILRLNPGVSKNSLRVGQSLRLPLVFAAESPTRGSRSTRRRSPANRASDAALPARYSVGSADAQTTLMLIDRLVDAKTALELAEHEVRLGKQGRNDVQVARIRLEAAKRRFELVREFAEHELRDAETMQVAKEADFVRASRLFKQGVAPKSALSAAELELQRARSRVRVLKRILK